MNYPVTKRSREALRKQHADRAAELAYRFGRTFTCERPDLAAHGTCTGRQFPERCLCPCHDDAPATGHTGGPLAEAGGDGHRNSGDTP